MSIVDIASPVFQPAMRVITAITQALQAQVTTNIDHDYIDGLIVRILVPSGYGMPQINNMQGTIIVNGTDTFLIDIDSTFFQAFTIPIVVTNYAQVIPIGEINDFLKGATVNVLPTGNFG